MLSLKLTPRPVFVELITFTARSVLNAEFPNTTVRFPISCAFACVVAFPARPIVATVLDTRVIVGVSPAGTLLKVTFVPTVRADA